MSLEFLSKILPTSQNSIAYKQMRYSSLGRETGIRKYLPDAIDVRVNAVAAVFFSLLDVAFTGTRLSLATLLIVPLFVSRTPIFKDFFCSVATLVKAALAILHGQSSGLLPPSTYEELSLAADNPKLTKSLLLALPLYSHVWGQEEILTNAINRIGKKECLELLWQHKKHDFIFNNIKMFNVNDFLEMYLKYDCVNRYYAYIDNQRVQYIKRKFSGDNPKELVISILSNKNIPDSVKANVGKLCCLQTGNKDETRAAASIIEALYKEGGDKNLRGITLILNNSPDLILTLSPEQFQLVQPRLSPTFESIKGLYEKRSRVFKEVLQKMPNSIAEVVDNATGESFIGFLLKKKDYRLALDLLRQNPDNIDTKTVIQILKHSKKFPRISQNEVEQLLRENYQQTIDLYKRYKDVTVATVSRLSPVEKLQAIGFLCYTGEPVLESLVKRGAIVALHKACPVKREVLQDIPGMDVIKEGLALFDALFKENGESESKMSEAERKSRDDENKSVRVQLKASLERHWGIANTPEIAKVARHVFKWMKENPDDREGHKAKLVMIANGYGNCQANKQGVVGGIWGGIRGLDVHHENDSQKKLHLYIASFKEQILDRILPAESHDRVKWVATLKNSRHVEPVLAEKDYFYNRAPETVNEALVRYDAHYHLRGMLDFLREGIKDPKIKLSGAIGELSSDSVASNMFTEEDRGSMKALFMDAKGNYTDFALFCVLVHLGYVQLK